MEELTVGSKAPEFCLPASDGTNVSLGQFKGKKIILYFYPKDNTPACFNQARLFSEAFDKITGFNAVILGISRDSASVHTKFAEKLTLPFVLLSDVDEDVCGMYDVIKDKNMYGKKVRGIERSTFIINEYGIISHIFRKVKVANHINEVMEALCK
ncbi:peroxiredoxin [Dendrosporobacter sp. 1207_IL3150]|uniref:peroxiredoxin n=1 Tax=Dendrosporobacter sp. 1207_IL3150 TaxID=3084054 RepID=UPI002FD9925F